MTSLETLCATTKGTKKIMLWANKQGYTDVRTAWNNAPPKIRIKLALALSGFKQIDSILDFCLQYHKVARCGYQAVEFATSVYSLTYEDKHKAVKLAVGMLGKTFRKDLATWLLSDKSGFYSLLR